MKLTSSRRPLLSGALLFAMLGAGAVHSAEPECVTLIARLGRHVAQAKAAAANWGRRWRTPEGATQNAVDIFVRDAKLDPDRLLMGWVTRIEHLPENLKWYQMPVQRLVRATHVKSVQGATGLFHRVTGRGRVVTPKSTYYLSAINGFQEAVVGYPNLLVRPLTRALTGQAKQLRLPWLLGIHAFYTADRLEELWQKMSTARLRRTAREKGPQIDREMEFNFVYHDFWEWAQAELRSGRADREKIRLLFLYFKDEMDAYFSYMESKASTQTFDQQLDRLLPLRSFRHIQEFIADREAGRPLPPNFRPRDGRGYKYSQEVVTELLDLNHAYLFAQTITHRAVRAKVAAAKLAEGREITRDEQDAVAYTQEMRAKDPVNGRIIDDIVSEDEADGRGWVKALFELHRRGRIDETQLAYRVQEANYYRRKFKEYDAIGVDLVVPLTRRDPRTGEEVAVLGADGQPATEIYDEAAQWRLCAEDLKTEILSKKAPPAKRRGPSSEGVATGAVPKRWVTPLVTPY